MRYWLLTTEYPPLFGGGISTYCYYTARMFAGRGHQVTVFIYDMTIKEDVVVEQEGIRVIRFLPRKTGAHHFLGFNAYLSYEYAEIVKAYVSKEGKPDIIESQEYHGIAYYLQQFHLLEYELFRELDIIITCHAPAFLCLEYNHAPIYRFPDYWTGQMERSVMRSADLLLSPSRYFIGQARERMDWTGMEEKYLPNPIEISGEAAQHFEQNKIVCFGKLSPLKGTFELMAFMAQLWDEGFTHPLHVIGGTHQVFHPEASTMGDLIRKKYGGYIQRKLLVLHGEMQPADARTELENAHVVLAPSILDNLPYTVLEAMSIGKVVLTSMQGGQKEVVSDGENGFLFDHSVRAQFKEKLVHILQLPKEDILRIGKAAADTVRTRFTPDIVYAQKMSLLKAFKDNRQPRRLFPFINETPAQPYAPNGESGLLSVVIPYYNMGAYIEECVRSVMASDCAPVEIIIVDDGSDQEKSIQALSHIQTIYPVRIHRKKNEGLAATRNFGAGLAKGEYLAFLDADDTVEKSYYSKAMAAIGRYGNVHFAGCWANYFGDAKGHWPAFNPEPPYLLIHNMTNSSALVYKKESFLQFGLNDEKLVYGMEDWDGVIGMIENGCGGVILPEALFNYRVRKDSMARAFTRVKRLYLYSLIANKHRSFYASHATGISNLLNANGSGLDVDNPTFDPPAHFSFISSSGKWTGRIKERIKQNKYLRNIAYKVYKKIK